MRRVLVLPLLVLALTGCGGGGDRLSEEEYREQANAACAELGRESEAVGEPESLSEVEEFANRLAEIGREGRDDLGGLEPPEELEADHDRLLASLDEAIAAVERLADAAAEGNASEVDEIAGQIAAKDAEADEIARKLGLDACVDA